MVDEANGQMGRETCRTVVQERGFKGSLQALNIIHHPPQKHPPLNYICTPVGGGLFNNLVYTLNYFFPFLFSDLCRGNLSEKNVDACIGKSMHMGLGLGVGE